MGGRGQTSSGKRTLADRIPRQASEKDRFIDGLARDLLNPDSGLSNGDMQGAVEAYAMQHPGVDEDAMMDAVRDRAEELAGMNKRDTSVEATQKRRDAGILKQWKANEAKLARIRKQAEAARQELLSLSKKESSAKALITRRDNEFWKAEADYNYFDRASYKAQGRIADMNRELKERKAAVDKARKKHKDAVKAYDKLANKIRAARERFEKANRALSNGEEELSDIPF